MAENIALIKEVHENISVVDANGLALDVLRDLDMENIADEYVNNCSQEEMFLVMFLRAVMTQESKVVVKLPSNLLGSLSNMRELSERMLQKVYDKKIIILDLESNETYYEGCQCNIEKLN